MFSKTQFVFFLPMEYAPCTGNVRLRRPLLSPAFEPRKTLRARGSRSAEKLAGERVRYARMGGMGKGLDRQRFALSRYVYGFYGARVSLAPIAGPVRISSALFLQGLFWHYRGRRRRGSRPIGRIYGLEELRRAFAGGLRTPASIHNIIFFNLHYKTLI